MFRVPPEPLVSDVPMIWPPLLIVSWLTLMLSSPALPVNVLFSNFCALTEIVVGSFLIEDMPLIIIVSTGLLFFPEIMIFPLFPFEFSVPENIWAPDFKINFLIIILILPALLIDPDVFWFELTNLPFLV